MVTDSISDLLTRIRNACLAGHESTLVPASKSKERVIKVLVDEGYVARYDEVEDKNGKPAFRLALRYSDDGVPVISELTRLSKPGRRLYARKDDIKPFRGGLGVVVISTSQGVISDREARKLGVGGELLCSVF